MRLATVDWVIIVGYGALMLAVGLYFSRRASRSVTDFFVSGRKLAWWAAGTSMVATTFAVDTPLLVAGWSREAGIVKNWEWWVFLFGQTFTTFFFAKLFPSLVSPSLPIRFFLRSDLLHRVNGIVLFR